MLETVGDWVVELTARLQRAWVRLDVAGVGAISSEVIAVRHTYPEALSHHQKTGFTFLIYELT